MESIIFEKAYAAKGTMEGNTIVGAGAVMGNIDGHGDLIMPGAFKKVVKQFLVDGFVPVGHNWADLPVGMPTKASEKAHELIIEAEFHTTQAAQDAKTVCQERLAKGLSVGLSIGFKCIKGGVAWFEEGAAFLEFLQKGNYDLSLFDTVAIKAAKYLRVILEIDELFECSIVTVPANRKARATQLKALNDFTGKGEVPDGLSFALHSETVLGAVREWVERAQDIKSQRDDKGTSMSPERIADLTQLHGLLGQLIDSMPVKSDPSVELRRLQLEALQIESELIGSV